MSKRVDGYSTLESLIVLSLATSRVVENSYTCENREQVKLAAGICAFAVAILFVFQAIVKQRGREVEMGREWS